VFVRQVSSSTGEFAIALPIGKGYNKI